MQYAKDDNGTLIYPSECEFIGIPNWRAHDAELRRRGYMPLVGEPEQGEPEPQDEGGDPQDEDVEIEESTVSEGGYVARPSAWHVVEQSTAHVEPRQVYEDVYEKSPETHELEKVGTRMVMRDIEVVLDASYIQVDAWEHVAVPPVPPPAVRYSKYKIQLACQGRKLWGLVKEKIASAGMADSWANIQDIASDNPELQAALPAIKEAFGADVVEAVLAESIAD